MTAHEVGKQYVALCKEGKNHIALETLFAPDAVSVEAGGPPGQDRTSKGLGAIGAKGKWWVDNHEVHKAEMHGPYPHDDRFAVHFTYDVTNKPSGMRMVMDEVALFTVANGKITKLSISYAVIGNLCSAEGTLSTTFSTPLNINVDHFATSSTGSGPSAVSYTMTGTFVSGTIASGTLLVTLSQSFPNPPCSGSSSLTWTASR